MDVFRIENLSCGYDKKKVLNTISFSVKKGDFLGIIGPNGAGKTTLFKALTGILKPSQGKIFYKDREVSHISPREFAREIAVIPQFLEVPFAFGVEEFVLMGRFPHNGRFKSPKKSDYKILEDTLSLTDTSTLRGMNISELSGGERQRVVLAQGFAQEPCVLLLDEPTAHLDITHKVRILDLIKRLNKEKNLTVIIILHDLNLASNYCNTLLLFNKGEIVKEGIPREVLTYQNIEEVYETVVLVKQNPLNQKPYVILVSEDDRKDSW